MPSALPCDVGLVFALGAEQGGFDDLLATTARIDAAGIPIRTGLIGSLRVAVVTSGPGREAAAKACDVLIDGHRPQWVVSAGFCGGLQPKLLRNDTVAANEFHDAPLLTEFLARNLATADASGAAAGLHRGKFLPVDRIVSKADAKRDLGERTGALACEMESLAVAETCLRRNVPFLAVRVVSDPVDEDLPDDLAPLMTSRGAARTLGSVLGTLWRRPSSVKDMWRLRETALIASDLLAKHLAAIIDKLPLKARVGTSSKLIEEVSQASKE